MDDDIDESCWLPADEPVVQINKKTGMPWRSDLSIEYRENGEVRFAQHQVRNIMNFIWQEGHITDQQHHDGQTYEIWRNMHRVQRGTIKAQSAGDRESMSVKLRAYGFVALLKRLRREDCQTIEGCIDTVSTIHTQFVARQFSRAYAGTFSRLSIVLQPIREQVRYLESLTDEERDALSNENLQKLLATIKQA